MFLRVILSSDSQRQLPRATNFSLFGSCHWSAILCSWVCDSPCELIYAISDDIVSKWLNSPCPACHPDPGEEKAGEGQGGDQAVAAVPFSHLLPTTAVFSLQLIRDILTKSVSAGMTAAGSGSSQRWWVGDSEEKVQVGRLSLWQSLWAVS